MAPLVEMLDPIRISLRTNPSEPVVLFVVGGI